MTKGKNIDAKKQTDKSQEKFTDEHLSENELDNVAGGTGGNATDVEFVLVLKSSPIDPTIYVSGPGGK